MNIENKWQGDGNGSMFQAKITPEEPMVPVLRENGEVVILFANSGGAITASLPVDGFTEKGKAVVRELVNVMRKIDLTSRESVKPISAILADAGITKTAVAALVNYLWFDGEFCDIPAYLQDIIW